MCICIYTYILYINVAICISLSLAVSLSIHNCVSNSNSAYVFLYLSLTAPTHVSLAISISLTVSAAVEMYLQHCSLSVLKQIHSEPQLSMLIQGTNACIHMQGSTYACACMWHVCICMCMCVCACACVCMCQMPMIGNAQPSSVQDVTAPLCKQCSNARSQKQPWASSISSSSLPLTVPSSPCLPSCPRSICGVMMRVQRCAPLSFWCCGLNRFSVCNCRHNRQKNMHGQADRQREEGESRWGVCSCRQTRRAAIIATRFALCNMNNFARKLFLILTPVEAAHSLKLRLDPAPLPTPRSCHSTAVGGCGQPRAKAQGMQGKEQGQGGWQVQHEFNFLLYSLQFAWQLPQEEGGRWRREGEG